MYNVKCMTMYADYHDFNFLYYGSLHYNIPAIGT